MNQSFHIFLHNAAMKKQMPQETLIANLKMLMSKTNMSNKEIAQKSGVSTRMIDYILNGQRGATIETAEKLANVFGLTGWQIIMPSLPYDIAKSGALDKLIKDFSHCGDISQQYISSVAQREAIYKVQ